MVNETMLQRELLAALPARLPRVKLFRRMVGTAEVRGAMVKFGVKGQSDLYGWDVHTGRHIEVELKAAGGRLSRDQEGWMYFASNNGVIALVLKAIDGESIANTIDRWLGELEGACSIYAKRP